jgi:transposase-like protein
VIPCFAFPPEVRRVVYTTKGIESIHARLRNFIKTRGHSRRRRGNQTCLAGAAQHYRRGRRAAMQWREAMNRFAIAYGDRFSQRNV